MGKLRKIAFYLMIPVVIICMIEGAKYFGGMGLTDTEAFLSSLDNTVKLFLARPTIGPHLAFSSIDDQYTNVEKVIVHIYAVLAILAPILMTTAIVAGFSAYIFDFVNSIKISFKDKMFIVGDGHMTKVIASKYAKKYYVNFLMPSDTTNEERVPILKEKIKAFPVDYQNIDASLKPTKLEKASYVVLNFKDWFKSYKTVTDVIEYLVKKNDGENSLPVYIVDAPGVFKNVFENTYRGFCHKYGKGQAALSFKYINVNDTNARNFFKEPHFTQRPDNVHHIVFTGIGGYGRAMLKELIAYMSRNNITGTVDIFDRSVETSLNNLMYSDRSLSIADKFTAAPTAKNAKISVDQTVDAGIIRSNYYQVNIGEFKATEYLSTILGQYGITEFFCCIENISASFECYRMIESYGDEFRNTNLYFRVGPQLENAFGAMQQYSQRLQFMPDGCPDFELIKD